MRSISTEVKPQYLVCENGGILTKQFSVMTNIKGRFASNGYVMLLQTGQLIIMEDYEWDFGTGAVDTEAVRCASLVHDALCDLIAAGCLPTSVRRAADKEYKKYLELYGMCWPRIQWQYYGIRLYVLLLKPLF